MHAVTDFAGFIFCTADSPETSGSADIQTDRPIQVGDFVL
jgi:hypothetical protein